ncbi:hypothetical protein BU26DRAFT_564999 [Trematosphaeria pertusa]|uniref:Uncharacterized protein n=1 Tax=Trematosphaeria pertusa TaxID=390896 RepID=A0A6A6IFJ4_9PLEO|nr:uncharacterized protein BU26DRAFT_564999 [Trematosphaeria pertusa]KAF2249344.1 hypothetical protein BU26DRAFT_564999 [Trematosphaeria pertusa]
MDPDSPAPPLEDLERISAISTGTLSDADALADLHARRANFAPENMSLLTPPQIHQGLSIFDHAIGVEAPAALQAGKAVVVVLRETMIATGMLVNAALSGGGNGEVYAGGGGEIKMEETSSPVGSVAAPPPAVFTGARDGPNETGTAVSKRRRREEKSAQDPPQHISKRTPNKLPKHDAQSSSSHANANTSPRPRLIVRLPVRVPIDYFSRPKALRRSLPVSFPASIIIPRNRKKTPPKPKPKPTTQPPDSDVAMLSPTHPAVSEASWETTSTSTTAHLSSLPPFPPFPPLQPRELTSFYKGLLTALENILEDAVSHPSHSLLDLVKNLDEEKPTVDDWERRTVLKGGEYVYEALRCVCEDEDEDDGRGDVGGGGGGEGVGALCRGLEEHARREYGCVEGRFDRGERPYGAWGERVWGKE